MSRVRGFGVLGLLIAVTLPLAAQDKKGDKGKKTTADIGPLVQAGEATGKITRIGTGTITLQVAQTTTQPHLTHRTVTTKKGVRRVPVETVQVKPSTKEY